jgi:predicted metal-dependent hydrolase
MAPTHPLPTNFLHADAPMVVRDDLDFGLDHTVPRHWFGGDAFRSRFFDAMSCLFPEGERFFIACVRDYKDQLTTPEHQQALLDFARQEAVHSKVHQRFNDLLARQGVKVERIQANQRRMLFDVARGRLSRARTLALTAASEHLTALMAHSFVARPELFADADPRVRAMYVWHAVEEVEHKGVAYDVMVDVAQVGYWGRAWALLVVSLQFPWFVFQILNHMLKVDGYNRWQRAQLWARGLWWLYGPGGMMPPLLRPYLAWFRPSFHPWQHGMIAGYDTWAHTLAQTRDAIRAADALQAGADVTVAPVGPRALRTR